MQYHMEIHTIQNEDQVEETLIKLRQKGNECHSVRHGNQIALPCVWD